MTKTRAKCLERILAASNPARPPPSTAARDRLAPNAVMSASYDPCRSRVVQKKSGNGNKNGQALLLHSYRFVRSFGPRRPYSRLHEESIYQTENARRGDRAGS